MPCRVNSVGVVGEVAGMLGADKAEFTSSINITELQNHESRTATSGRRDGFGIVKWSGCVTLTE